MPPSVAEEEAYSKSFIAGGVQNKRHTKAAGHIPIVPAGLSPQLRVHTSLHTVSPFECDIPIPEDMEFACRVTLELGSRADAWRRSRFADLARACEVCNDLTRAAFPTRSHSSSAVRPDFNLERNLGSAASILWPDDITSMISNGASPLGPQRDICFSDGKENSRPQQQLRNFFHRHLNISIL